MHLLFGLILLSAVSSEENRPLKVSYLENLIDKSYENAKNYRGRSDNVDLVGGVDLSGTDGLFFGKFDFIVIGCGSAGSVVASRLSENPKFKVLVLEAGELNDDLTDIPNLATLAALSDRAWGYKTIPQQKGCFGRKNHQCPYIRGKILGGSGSINGLVYSRGIKHDFDMWEQMGNKGWGWDDILKIFKKIENYQSNCSDLRYRGFNGPLNVAHAKLNNRLHQEFVESFQELGYEHVQDYNAEKIMGVSRIQHNIKHGRRISGANTYMSRAFGRFNLNVTLKAFVTRIIINDDKKAIGVEFVKDSKKYYAFADKEVILSGGSVNSPQLLMISGVGPREELERHGIKVVQNLPVGKYMKDHIGFLTLYFKSNYTESTKTLRELIQEFLNGQGWLTSPTYYHSIVYYNTRNKSSTIPNMEIDFAPPSPKEFNYPTVNNYDAELDEFVRSSTFNSDFNLQIYFLHPKSSGVLRLKSSNPRDFPLIDPKIFDCEEDLEDMYQGILTALKVTETSIGRKYNLKLNLPLRSCQNFTENSREFWYCALRQVAFPAYHLSSTAKMGPRNDPLAVVSPELKVHGVGSLRVVDVSIVPHTVTGHINAQAFAIGEKGAELIIGDHLK